MAARIEIIEMTTSSSMSVNPCSPRLTIVRVRAVHMIFSILTDGLRLSQEAVSCLPVLVLRAVERRCRRLGVDVEDVLPTPRGGVGLVLIRAQAPLRGPRNRIDRHLAQELELAPGLVVDDADAF